MKGGSETVFAIAPQGAWKHRPPTFPASDAGQASDARKRVGGGDAPQLGMGGLGYRRAAFGPLEPRAMPLVVAFRRSAVTSGHAVPPGRSRGREAHVCRLMPRPGNLRSPEPLVSVNTVHGCRMACAAP